MSATVPTPPAVDSMQPPAARETWIDTARGIAIVLVVLFHAVLYTSQIGLAGPWSKLAFTLDTFRMPLFFFISGMLAGRVLAGPLLGVLRYRALNFVYLYLVWSLLLIGWTALLPGGPVGRRDGATAAATLLTWPNDNIWFLYALAIFFIAGRLIRPLPIWLQIAVPALLSALFASGVLDTASTPWDKTCRYWFFFVLASHIGPAVRRVARGARTWHAFAFGGLYVLLLVVLVLHGLDRILFVRPLLGLLAVATGCTVAVAASRTRRLDLLRLLGTRTLPIYLVHTFPMIALVALLPTAAGGVPAWLSVILVPSLTAATISLALLLHRLIDGRLPGVFRFPVTAWITPPDKYRPPRPPSHA